MKIIILTTLLALQLFAINPKAYAALGDKVFNNLDGIEKLKRINEFKMYKEKIQDYNFNVKAIKDIGFMIDKGNSNISKKEYLKKLRKLSKTNDFFIESVNSAFAKSLKDENSVLFLNLINTGLINTNKHKNTIKKYYYSHKNDLNIDGTVIEKFVNQDKKNKKRIYIGPTKEEIQKAKIQRIRAKDKARQEAISKSIEEELLKKKKKIREDQKKELRTK